MDYLILMKQTLLRGTNTDIYCTYSGILLRTRFNLVRLSF